MHEGKIHWGEIAGNAWDWFNSDESAGLRNLMGAAGQLATAEGAVNRLQGLGALAKTRIGMPEENFWNTIKGETKFTPFSVTTGAGSVTTQKPQLDAAGNQMLDAAGNPLFIKGAPGDAFYNMSENQAALANSLRTGGTDFLNASLGRGAYGRPRLDAAGNQLRDAAGNLLYDDAPGYGLEQYIGTNKSLTDPFSAANLAAAETALFGQLQNMRQAGQARDQLALDEKLFSQGRTGLQTSAYGGSPEQFAFEQAKLEQEAQDQLMAMQQARADAANIAEWRQRGIGEAREDRALSGDMAGAFLDASYQPTRELVAAMQPSLNMSSDATVAGRQLGGYGKELAGLELDYKLGAEQMASDIRREALNSIFDLLMSEQAAKGNVASSAVGRAAGNPLADLTGITSWDGLLSAIGRAVS